MIRIRYQSFEAKPGPLSENMTEFGEGFWLQKEKGERKTKKKRPKVYGFGAQKFAKYVVRAAW